MDNELKVAYETIKEWGVDADNYVAMNYQMSLHDGEATDDSIQVSNHFLKQLKIITDIGLEKAKEIIEEAQMEIWIGVGIGIPIGLAIGVWGLSIFLHVKGKLKFSLSYEKGMPAIDDTWQPPEVISVNDESILKHRRQFEESEFVD